MSFAQPAPIPLFSRSALEKLIESYPSDRYDLVHMGAQGDRKLWRYGNIGEATGAQVIEAIAAGRLWINLLHVNEVDSRYGDLLDGVFAEVEARVPGYTTFRRINGILISTPRAQVYYHIEPSGQSAWQIEGSKPIYLYPPVPPFLTQESLEHVALCRDEVSIKYEPSFEDHATAYELRPGFMMHWLLNSPHRVENLDCMNISMTTEYFTEESRHKQIVNAAIGLLREKLRVRPSRNLSGAGFGSKAVMQAGIRRLGLLEGRRKQRREVTFKLDRRIRGRFLTCSRSHSFARNAR